MRIRSPLLRLLLVLPFMLPSPTLAQPTLAQPTLAPPTPAQPTDAEPALVIESPQGEALTAESSVRVTGRVSAGAALRIGGVAVAVDADGRFDHAVELSEGDNALVVTATGTDGKAARRTVRVIRDSLPPRIGALSPRAGSVLPSGSFAVHAQVADPHLDSVRIGDQLARRDGASFAATLERPAGTHAIVIEARDRAGNVSKRTLELRFDGAPPVIDLRIGDRTASGDIVSAEPLAPEIVVDDEGETRVEATLDGRAYVPGTVIGEGRHQLVVTATDAAGRTTRSARTITVDRTPPRLEGVRVPARTEPGAASVVVEGRAEGAERVAVDGHLADVVDGRFAVEVPVAEGRRPLRVEAFDAAGNRTTFDSVVTKDASPPALVVDQPAEGAVVGVSPVTVTGTATDPELASVTVAGTAASFDAGGAFSAPASLAEGANVISVVATDVSSNAATVDRTVVLDTIAPAITLTVGGAPLEAGAVLAAPVVPAAAVDDATATTVDALLDGAPFVLGSAITGSGSYELEVAASDAAGNLATVIRSFTVDADPPQLIDLLPADATVTAALEVSLSGRAPGASAVTVNGQAAALVGDSWSLGPLALSEGVNALTVVASDAAGNHAQLTHTLVRDTQAPALAIAAPAEGALRLQPAVDVTGTASDPHLASVTVNGTPASRTGSSFVALAVPLAEGPNTLTIRAEDTVGNATEATRNVALDQTAPVLAITDPAAGSVVPDAAIIVRGTVSDLHLDRVEVNGLAAAVTAGTWSRSVGLVAGVNTISVAAIDALGNRSDAQVTISRDSQAPEIAILVPGDGVVTQAPSVDVSGTVGDEAGVVVTVGGVAASVTAGSFGLAGVALAPGENRIVARATDSLGNQGIHVRNVVRDNQPPTLIAVEPPAGALAIAPTTVFRLSFDEAVATPVAGAWRLEDAAGQAIAASAEHEGAQLRIVPSAPLPSTTDVVLVLTAGIADAAGNALTPASLSFRTADTGAPPAPSLDAVAAYVCADSVLVSGTAEVAAQVAISGGAALAVVRADDAGAFAVTVALVPETQNLLSAVAADSDGNVSPPATASVVHDCTPPSVLSALAAATDRVDVRFDEPMSPASVAAAISLSADSGPLTGSVSLEPAGRLASFVATGPLPAAGVTLKVADSAQDLTGNRLAFPYEALVGGGLGDGFLSGTVIDDATGRPLAGARVVITASDGVALAAPLPARTTGADGRFLLPAIAGTHDLTIAKDGYTPVLRAVTTRVGEGTDVFDPRLTAVETTATVGTAGGDVATPGGLVLGVAAGALSAETQISATTLGEQALTALLPYGWSPRGAAWIDFSGSAPSAASTLALPVEAADGTPLVVASLDLLTLQWRAQDLVSAAGGSVMASVDGTGAVVAVEADAGVTAPPPAVVGSVLGSSAPPVGGELSAAAISFDPQTVSPTQTSLATVDYTLAAPAASGAPLTLRIVEQLELLDGSTRSVPAYRADLVLYASDSGQPRSRFRLQPSATARLLPIALGSEDVSLSAYRDESVRGNVLGPEGGSVLGDAGDRVDLPAGALAAPTPVVLTRKTPADLPLGEPRGTVIDAVLELDLGGAVLALPATLRASVEPAPPAAADGILLHVTEHQGAPVFRPVARLVATAIGWASAAIDPLDLPWPGATAGGLYAFARFTVDFGFLRGTARDLASAPLAGAVLDSPQVDWIQRSNGDGSYVLPLPVGAADVTVTDPVSGNQVLAQVTIGAADARVDLDPTVALVAPAVVEIVPADGATGIPAGVEPTVRFSEAIDAASVAAGVRLFDGADDVGAIATVTGALVRLAPQASLVPGRSYRIVVTRDVLDLAGNPLDAGVETGFTVASTSLPDSVTPARIFLVEPDGSGLATIRGLAAAVPSGTLVFAENTSRFTNTESVAAAQDGSFTLGIEAALGDRLLLHILIIGANEVLLPLDVFMAADLRTANVGGEAVSFTTVDGIGLSLEAGTFAGGTRLRATATPIGAAPLATPTTMTGLYGFSLDFGGARAARPLAVRLPLANLAAAPAAGDGLILASSVEALGRRWWLLDDLLRIDGDAVTNADTSPGNALVAAGGTQRAGAASRFAVNVPIQSAAPRLPGAMSVTVMSVVPDGARLAPAATKAETLPLGNATPESVTAAPSPAGITHAGEFRLMAAPDLSLLAIPAFNPAIAYTNPSNGFIGLFLSGVAPELWPTIFYLPTSLGQPAIIEGWDLARGDRLFREVLPAPSAPVIEVPPGIVGDLTGPGLVGGSPFELAVFQGSGAALPRGMSLAVTPPAIPGEAADLELTVPPTAAAAGTRVYFHVQHPLSRRVSGLTLAAADLRLKLPLDENATYAVSLGGEIAPSQSIELEFDEPVVIPAGIKLFRGSRSVPATVVHGASPRQVRVRPSGGWQAGPEYRLQLDDALADAHGNGLLAPPSGCTPAPCGHQLSIGVSVRESQVLGTLDLAPVRDVARLGSLLFVAAGGNGLAVVDAADPTELGLLVPTLPLSLNDPVTGVEIDPHGRVVYVGGGVANSGQLRMLDVQTLDPDALAVASNPDWRDSVVIGRSVVSDRFDQDNHPQLASGKPVDVTLVSDDARDVFKVGDAPPEGIGLVPAVPPAAGASFALTVSGAGIEAGLPVTLRNLTRGSFRRVDTAADGSFAVTLEVRAGERLELLRNKRSFAYVALEGTDLEASLVIVDLSKVWRRTITEQDLGPTAGVLANFFSSDIQITQAQASSAFCSANAVSEMVDLRQVMVMEKERTVGALTERTRTLLGLARSYGLVLLDIKDNDLTHIRLFLDGQCGEVDGVRRMSGLALAEAYEVEVVGAQAGTSRREIRDLAIIANEIGVLLVVDISNRDAVRLVSRVRLPGPIGRLVLDRENRRLIVAGRGAGLYLVSLDRLSLEPLDGDGDGVDDRLLETVAIGADNISAMPLLVPELGIAYAGGLAEGVTGVTLGEPTIRVLVRGADGRQREALELAPFGVPTAAEGGAAGGADAEGLIWVEALLPGAAAEADGTIRLELTSQTPEGARAGSLGTLDGTAGTVPATAFACASDVDCSDALVLRRQAGERWQEGYGVFVSDPVVLLADVRASVHVAMTAAERAAPDLCPRCDLVAAGVYPSAEIAAAAPFAEMLSGHFIHVAVSPPMRIKLAEIYDALRIDAAEPQVASVPWDLSPALRQEPTRNPAYGSGDVAPGTLLHSGELTISQTDLAIRGRGFDFAFVRTHRNQTLGNGPFGPGWDHNLRQRLRALPSGDVEYFDGRGRRERFTSQGSGFKAPAGRFWTLERNDDGFVLIDAGRMRRLFDRHGRLVAVKDAVAVAAGTGNQMTLGYDQQGRLETAFDTLGRTIRFRYDEADRITEIEDFTGRVFAYRYDSAGRLESFRAPAVATVAAGSTTAGAPAPLETRYSYDAVLPGALGSVLRRRDNVKACQDPKHAESWLEISYTDVDGDGHAEEVSGETWGGEPLAIAYAPLGSSAAVTDRRGNVYQYTMTAEGQTAELIDAANARWSWQYNGDGLVTHAEQPLGRTVDLVYADAAERRAQGNVLSQTVTPDGRGANGSDGTLTATYQYDADTNQPIAITDARNATTTIVRQAGSGLPTVIAQPEGVGLSVEYNDFGQPTRIENARGNVATFRYFTASDGASNGYLRAQVVGENDEQVRLETQYKVDARGNVTSVIDARGIRHEAAYNVLDWPIEQVAAVSGGDGAAPLGYASETLYDANGNVAVEKRPFGEAAGHTENRYSYDLLDAVTKVEREIDAGIFAVTQLARDQNRNVIAVTDPEGNRVETDFDARDLPLARRSNLGLDQVGPAIEETFSFNDDRELVAVTDGRGNTWTTEYDGYGRVAETADPLLDAHRTAYDNAGNATCMVDIAQTVDPSSGAITSTTLLAASTQIHDLLGRPTKVRQHLWRPDEATPAAGCPSTPIADSDFPAFGAARVLATIARWDLASNLEESQDALGRVTRHVYDAAERLIRRLDAAGNEQHYGLDKNGNVTSFRSVEEVEGGAPVSVITTTTYDALDRPRESRDGLGNLTKTTYDARNLLRQAVDPESFVTSYTYDGLDRRIREARPEGIVTTTTWDKASRQISYRDALGNQTTWTYDAANRRKSQTLPGGDTWQYAYDLSHNLEIVTDANGTKTTNVYDPKNRLSARSVVPGAGVVGPLSESYAYDGLDRTTSASSGTVSTDLTYDSASRLLTDTTLGRTVAYGYDEVHNRIKTTYPSGHVVDIAVDVLDRPDTVTVAGAGVPAVDYGYRGPWLRQKSTYANGLEGTSSFDATWRPTQTTVGVSAAPAAAFEETLAWSPRSLKSAVGLGDAAGRGYVLEHDGAQRVKRAAISSSAAAMANNSVPNLPIDPSRAFDYSYDAAQNLLGHTSVNAGAETPFALPNDASGRNRPGSAGGAALGYDANGNRSADSGRQLRYDFRNRLTEVRDAGGALIASYTYDAFNRRVRKDVVGQPVEEMVYAGWQELERYVVGAQGAGTLDQRYTRGTGIDEIVRMEADVDANGSLETAWTPIYDHTGNLVKLTGGAGEVVARYDYSPFGEAFTAHSDLVAPEAQLIAIDPAAGRITINVDHEARLDQAAVVIEDLTPPPLSLSVPGAKAAGILTRSISRPVSEGPVAGRRFEIVLDILPAEGTPMRLTVPAAALVDRFGNPLAADLVVDFTWPAAASGIQVLADTASPEIERIRLDQGFVEVTFSEPPAAGAASAITINQVVPNQVIAMTWTEQVDGHSLRADTALVAGSYLLDIDSVAPVDLSGRGLSTSFQQVFEIPAVGEVEIPFERPDPTVVPPAAFVNRFAFHGRPVDEETGLVYFRNRYFDPSTGRFISPDPYGYLDSPSMYTGFANSPLNYSDPLGLFDIGPCVGKQGAERDECKERERKQEEIGGEFAMGAAHGAVTMPVHAVAGVYQAVRHPIQTAKGLWYIGTNFPTVAAEAWVDFTFASHYEKGQFFGNLAAGFGAAGAAAKGARFLRGFSDDLAAVTDDAIVAGARAGVDDLMPRGFPEVPRAGTRLSDDVLRLAEQNLTNTGDTVLGSYPGYINKANARGASFFDVGNAWEALTPGQRTAANNHFLDVITARGDRVLLSVQKSQIQQGTALADEVAYLTGQKGYVWVNQWSLRPGD